jgi:hypothetical protein
LVVALVWSAIRRVNLGESGRRGDTMTYDIYMYEIAVLPQGETPDISGFSVEATDGSIGTVDEHTYDVGASYLVVDTGPWIFGRKVMLPAGVIREVDLDDEVIYVDRTKDEIKDSPDFDETTYRDESYRSSLGDYYSSRRM